MKPLHPDELKKLIILLFLVNQDGEAVSYSMMRTMSRKYLMNDYTGVIKNGVAQEFIEYIKSGDEESYKITAAGQDYYNMLLPRLREELDTNYPMQKDFTALLMD